jgi:20S proteasome subunit beta 2
MSQAAVDVPPKGGFSFDLCRRNDMLSKKGVPPPSFRKTGTTIVGLIFLVYLYGICLLGYEVLEFGI